MANINPHKQHPGMQVRELSGRRVASNLAGSPLPEGYRNKSSLVFDGVSDYAVAYCSRTIPESANSISFWFKIDDPPKAGWNGILWTGADSTNYGDVKYHINYYAGAYIQMRYGDGENHISSVGGHNSFNYNEPGNWIHLCVTDTSTKDADGTVTMYINGCRYRVFDGTAWAPAAANSGRYQILIGRFGPANSDYLAGKLDEITVWDRALTLEAVQVLYNRKTPTDPRYVPGGPPVHWWRGGEGLVGTIIRDEIGSSPMTTYNGISSDPDTATELAYVAPNTFSGWTPASISNLIMWIDPSDSSTVKPAGGSYGTAVDGDAIESIRAKNNDSIEFTQSTSSLQPLWGAVTGQFNGLHILKGNNNHERLIHTPPRPDVDHFISGLSMLDSWTLIYVEHDPTDNYSWTCFGKGGANGTSTHSYPDRHYRGSLSLGYASNEYMRVGYPLLTFYYYHTYAGTYTRRGKVKITGGNAVIDDANTYAKARQFCQKMHVIVFDNKKFKYDLLNKYNHHFRPGMILDCADQNSPDFMDNDLNSWYIQTHRPTTGIGTMLAYGKALSDRELGLLRDYISNKWDIPVDPYYSNRATHFNGTEDILAEVGTLTGASRSTLHPATGRSISLWYRPDNEDDYGAWATGQAQLWLGQDDATVNTSDTYWTEVCVLPYVDAGSGAKTLCCFYRLHTKVSGAWKKRTYKATVTVNDNRTWGNWVISDPTPGHDAENQAPSIYYNGSATTVSLELTEAGTDFTNLNCISVGGSGTGANSPNYMPAGAVDEIVYLSKAISVSEVAELLQTLPARLSPSRPTETTISDSILLHYRMGDGRPDHHSSSGWSMFVENHGSFGTLTLTAGKSEGSGSPVVVASVNKKSPIDFPGTMLWVDFSDDSTITYTSGTEPASITDKGYLNTAWPGTGSLSAQTFNASNTPHHFSVEAAPGTGSNGMKYLRHVGAAWASAELELVPTTAPYNLLTDTYGSAHGDSEWVLWMVAHVLNTPATQQFEFMRGTTSDSPAQTFRSKTNSLYAYAKGSAWNSGNTDYVNAPGNQGLIWPQRHNSADGRMVFLAVKRERHPVGMRQTWFVNETMQETSHDIISYSNLTPGAPSAGSAEDVWTIHLSNDGNALNLGIGEAGFIAGTLDNNEIRSLYSWAAEKWNITPYWDNTRSVVLDGVSDYATGGSPIDATQAFSFSCWVKIDVGTTTSQYKNLVRLYDSATNQHRFKLTIHKRPNTWHRIDVFISDGAGGSTSQPDAYIPNAEIEGVWGHIAVTFAATSSATGDTKLYFNGELVETDTGSAALDASATIDQLMVGGPANYFPGKTTEHVWYQDVLTDEEVHQIYNGQDRFPNKPSDPRRPPNPAGAVSHYRFGNAISGTTVPDQIGSTDLTLNGGVSVSPDVP